MKFRPTIVTTSALFALNVCAQVPINPAVTKGPAGAVSPNIGAALTTVVQCPTTIDVAATNASSPWVPNTVRLYVDTVLLTNQPVETQQMVCRYKGSGYEWAVMQQIRPTYKSCIANGKSSFSCTKN